MNCHGCKWLDQVKGHAKGEGYCSMVVRSKNYNPGDRVRRAQNNRCKLFEHGDFKMRFSRTKESEK